MKQTTFQDKQALAGFLVSLLGIFIPYALPAQMIGFLLGIKGLKADKYKMFARIAVIYSGVCFLLSGLAIFAGYYIT